MTVEYSYTKTMEANPIIHGHMMLFVDVVLFFVEKSNIRAIVIEGSFGRGEGGVIKSKGGFEPVNDYDFLLILDASVSAIVIDTIKTEFKNKINIWRVDITQYTFGKLNTLKPTLRNYDLKYGSTIIFGDQHIFSGLPEWRANQIHAREAEKLLFTRSIGFILTLQKNDIPENETLGFMGVQQLSKAVIAAADSYLMIRGSYNHSYVFRKKILLDSSYFTVEEKEIISWAFNFKLFPTKKYQLHNEGVYKKCLTFYLKMFSLLIRKMYKYRCHGFLHYDVSYLLSIRKWSIIFIHKIFKNNTDYLKSLMLGLSQYYLLENLATNSNQMLSKSVRYYRRGYRTTCTTREQLIGEIIKVRI